jgi:hypothetical protein
MRRLAARTPVLWINSIGMRAPAPGRTELPLRRYARKLTSTLKGLRRDPCGMWVYSPLFIPRYTPTVLRWNGRLLFEQVRLLQRWIGIQRPAVWATVPTVASAVERGVDSASSIVPTSSRVSRSRRRADSRSRGAC